MQLTARRAKKTLLRGARDGPCVHCLLEDGIDLLQLLPTFVRREAQERMRLLLMMCCTDNDARK